MKSTWWRLRGALDVPKERFILYPGCERSGDGTPVIGWAGWNHLQQAKALAAFYLKARTQQGWSREKLVPLLAGLADLIPWLLQWHNDVDPDYNLRMGDYYEGFLKEELRALELPMSELAKWAPGAEGRSTAPSSIGHRIAVQEVTEAPEPRRGQVIDMLSAAKGLIRNQEVAAVAESGEQGPRAEDLAGRDRLGYRQSGGGQVPRDKAHK